MNYSPDEKADKCDIFKGQREKTPACLYVIFLFSQWQGSEKEQNERKSVREA